MRAAIHVEFDDHPLQRNGARENYAAAPNLQGQSGAGRNAGLAFRCIREAESPWSLGGVIVRVFSPSLGASLGTQQLLARPGIGSDWPSMQAVRWRPH